MPQALMGLFGGRRSKQTWRNLVRNVIAWIVVVTARFQQHTLNVLDLTLYLQEGLIITDIYAKPTDSHFYLPFSSSHPAHCKRAIPYGVALRVRRNCSTDEFLNKRCVEYKGYLKSQGYNADLVDSQFDRTP